MKIYLNQNVFEASLERIRYFFDEFDNIIVNISGGKDSTVVLNLALRIAEEKNKLPLKVVFIDQEAEWQCVIDYIREIMYDPRVSPYWFQMPIKIFNATSSDAQWLYCWEEGKKWIREKEAISKKENIYGTDRFAKLFPRIMKVEFPPRSCFLAGVRCEENPKRFIGLTYHKTYKDITYGKVLNKKNEQYSFYPIYDWSYKDVWKAIYENNWKYCKIYDYMYQYGLPIRKMRVSNVHHATAVHTLFYLQEIEPENWSKIVERLAGVNTAGKLGKDDFFLNEAALPAMFQSWREYRDFLLEKLIKDPSLKEKYRKKFIALDEKYAKMKDISILYKWQIKAILINDFTFTTFENFETMPITCNFREFLKKGYARKRKGGSFIPTN